MPNFVLFGSGVLEFWPDKFTIVDMLYATNQYIKQFSVYHSRNNYEAHYFKTVNVAITIPVWKYYVLFKFSTIKSNIESKQHQTFGRNQTLHRKVNCNFCQKLVYCNCV